MGVSAPLLILVSLIVGTIILVLAVIFMYQATGHLKNVFEEMVEGVKNFIRSLFKTIIPF
ncbi:MAG: hypothetical protein RMJ17_01640 [Candidatus Aenigmarchaeota archaeon]|nr:hypothetical protein [Candidatus Aenigmarchaeota archaeon]MDW8149280.1 hypothetical protein [Candidatus Aenigmarchaeota archaeon]